MNIKLDDKYSIASDDTQITLNVTATVADGENAGKEYTRSVGYYSTLEQALNGYARRLVLASEATTITELRRDLQSIKAQIAAFVKV